MKKILLLALTLLLCLSIIGCQTEKEAKNEDQTNKTENQQASNEDPLEKIKASKKLVMGTNANYPPFEFHKNVNGEDKIMGFDIFIAEEIAKELGVELVIEDMDFAAVLQSVQTGIIDVAVAGINNTAERREVMDFSEVYYESKYTVLVKDENVGKYNTPEKMSQEKITVGVQTGTVQEKIANKIEGITIVSIPKTPDLVLQLKSGLVDAILTENTVADLYATENEELESDPNGEFEGETGAAIAVQKGNDQLLSVVNKVLARLKEEGKIQDFYDQALKDAVEEK